MSTKLPPGCPCRLSIKRRNRKRLLRFLASAFPIDAVMRCWLVFVLERVCHPGTARPLILVDETKLINNFKALVAAVPFRQRAIPIYWHIYSDAEIQDMTYKSHNEIVQRFCLTVYRQAQTALPHGCEPHVDI